MVTPNTLNADGQYFTTSEHLSDVEKRLLVEKLTGDVDRAYINASMLRNWIQVRPVKGTDKISVRRVGNSTIRRATLGVTLGGDVVKTDKITLTVDTLLYAREMFSKLGEVQDDINMEGQMAMNHGELFGKLFDISIFIVAAKAAQKSEANDMNGAFLSGQYVELDAAGDELDPDKVVDKLETIYQAFVTNEIPTSGMKIFVRPEIYTVISNHPKLINQDYSPNNGSYAQREVKYLCGLPILETPRIINTVTEEYKNLFDNELYNIDAATSKVIALMFDPRALIVGESIEENSDIWYEKKEKTWFVDTDRSYAVGIRNAQFAAALAKVTA